MLKPKNLPIFSITSVCPKCPICPKWTVLVPKNDNEQYVKYDPCVQIVTRTYLEEAMEAQKDAADELKKWRRTVKAARWRRLEEVRSIFTDADDVNDYVIFNIRVGESRPRGTSTVGRF